MSTIEFWHASALIVAALGQTVFVLFYMTREWWRNYLGRALFVKALTLMLLIDVGLTGIYYDWEHEHATFVTFYWMMALAIWAQLVAFLRNARNGKVNTYKDND